MQVCTLLQTDNHPTTQFFYRPDALPAAQPTASKHQKAPDINNKIKKKADVLR